MALTEGARPLYQVVNGRLVDLWENAEWSGRSHGPRRTAVKPDRIVFRSSFVYGSEGSDTAPPITPIAPTLVSNGRGLALRLALLLVFDAQCRALSGRQVENVRTIASVPDEAYRAWSNLVVSYADVSRDTGRGGPQLRRRQITEALLILADRRLIDLPAPTRHRGRSRYDSFHLLDDSGQPQHPRYVVPDVTRGPGIPREFFTNGWLWALTDAEIAVYLMLAHRRWTFPGRHEANGIFVTVGDRTAERGYAIRRATYRGHQMLFRFGLVNRVSVDGRDFETGKVRDFTKDWEAGSVEPHRFTIVDEGLQRPAFETIDQVLNRPTLRDDFRRMGF